MNSLLSGLGNSLMGGTGMSSFGNNMPSILLQALGAAMRHESPQDFMARLANQHPQLKQYDLTNLQTTAQQVCQEKGVNMQEVVNQVDNMIGPVIK